MDMSKKKRVLSVLSLLILTFALGNGAYSFFTDHQLRELQAQSGVSLTLSGDAGVTSVSQSGYIVKKGAAGWYRKDSKASVSTVISKGYSFRGWWNGSTKVSDSLTFDYAVNAYTELVAKTEPTVYTNKISHCAWGFQNGEGTNPGKDAYLLGTTTFSQTYHTKYVLDSDKSIAVPNGYVLSQHFGTGYLSEDGSWKTYPFGTEITQQSEDMTFEYDCYPVSYDITYRLDGGKNHPDNPASYNVLYGVSLKNPAREGYMFDGWKDEKGNLITGINEGKGGKFASGAELYAELEKRTTGNQTLTAQWSPKTYSDWIEHWLFGFQNKEGQNGIGDAYHLKTVQGILHKTDEVFQFSESDLTTIPNGCIQTTVGYYADALNKQNWVNKTLSANVIQQPIDTLFQINYSPLNYSITYALGSGTNNIAKNHKDNPSSYNVLYGVTLKNPTKPYSDFLGWYDGDTKVTGINPGANATFTSVADLYAKLAARNTGNKTLTAKWSPWTYTISFDANGASGSMGNLVAEIGESNRVPKNAFIKTGYVFDGWKVQIDDGTGRWMYKDSNNTSGQGQFLTPGKEPAGWVQWKFGDNGTTSQLSTIDGQKFKFVAQWKLDKLVANLPESDEKPEEEGVEEACEKES